MKLMELGDISEHCSLPFVAVVGFSQGAPSSLQDHADAVRNPNSWESF